jgi:hypothetical protein
MWIGGIVLHHGKVLVGGGRRGKREWRWWGGVWRMNRSSADGVIKMNVYKVKDMRRGERLGPALRSALPIQIKPLSLPSAPIHHRGCR